MKLTSSAIFNDVYLVDLPRFEDERGSFVKTFHLSSIENEIQQRFEMKEGFLTYSKKDVLRGMHFQTPPADHQKFVQVYSGAILDVVVDLRKDSPTYGQFDSFELTGDGNKGLLIPSGFAHGFLSLQDGSAVNYFVTSQHSPENDAGIAWDSFGFDWPVAHPIISNRDQEHPPLSDFKSPF